MMPFPQQREEGLLQQHRRLRLEKLEVMMLLQKDRPVHYFQSCSPVLQDSLIHIQRSNTHSMLKFPRHYDDYFRPAHHHYRSHSLR